MKNLDDLRNKWEKGLQVLDFERLNSDELVVLLRTSGSNVYHCHYYFKLENQWYITLKVQNALYTEALSGLTTAIRESIQNASYC